MSLDITIEWVDGDHAVHGGKLTGTLIGAGLAAWPILDDAGNVTPIIRIESHDLAWSVVVLPEGSTEPVDS